MSQCPECKSSKIYYIEHVVQYHNLEQFPSDAEDMELSSLNDSYEETDMPSSIWCYDCDTHFHPVTGKKIKPPIRGDLDMSRVTTKTPKSKFKIPKRMDSIEVGHWTIDLLQTRNGNLAFTVYERGKNAKDADLSIDGVVMQTDHTIRGNTQFHGIRRLECNAPRSERHLE